MVSACHISLGRAASKRTKEERGRFWGWGVTRPWRERMRQMVPGRGDLGKALLELVTDAGGAGVVAGGSEFLAEGDDRRLELGADLV